MGVEMHFKGLDPILTLSESSYDVRPSNLHAQTHNILPTLTLYDSFVDSNRIEAVAKDG